MKCALMFSVMLVFSVLTLCAPANAAPSFYGYSGLIVIPTVDVLSTGDFSVGGFGLNVEEGADSNVYTANLGLGDALEAGFARVKPDDAPGETLLNAKYCFTKETESRPGFAAGFIDLTDECDSTAYIVMSKSFKWSGATRYGEINASRVHLGVGGGMLDGLFGGISIALGDKLMLMAEYDTEDINFGMRLALSHEVRAHVAFLEGADDVGIGVSFTKAK